MAETDGSARHTGADGGLVEVVQIVRATPLIVFQDLTVPARLTAWWRDSSMWWLTRADIDLRVGGQILAVVARHTKRRSTNWK